MKNKKFVELKYTKWLFNYFGNSIFKCDSSSKFKGVVLKSIPRNLGVPLDDNFYPYWFPLFDLCFYLDYDLPSNYQAVYKNFVEENIKSWKDVNNKKLFMILSDFIQFSLIIWRLSIMVMNDLYGLYVQKNYILTERDFILLDFWFESLPVIDELFLQLRVLSFELKFKVYTYDFLEVDFDTRVIPLRELNETNLLTQKCENWWGKTEYVNHIYKQFAKIDENLLYQWLVYKNIPNLYETKTEYIHQFITNEINGLNSLSLDTLKLLAVNPLLDLDYARQLYLENIAAYDAYSKANPEEIKKRLENLKKSLIILRFE